MIPGVTGLRARIVWLSTLVMSFALLVTVALVMSFFSAGLRDGTDRLLREDARAIGSLLLLENQHVELFTLSSRDPGNDEFLRHLRFQVREREGRVLFGSDHFNRMGLPLSGATGQPTLNDAQIGGEWLRILSVPVTLRNGSQRAEVIVQTARSIQPFVKQEQRLWSLLGWMLPVPIVLMALGSAAVATITLRPVNRMSVKALHMGADNLGERLPVVRQDEVGRLAMAFNRLLERLEFAFLSLRRFTADASHELRSPLTAVRTQGEVALDQARSPVEYREAIGGMLEDIGRLERLTGTLLELARADNGMVKPALAPLPLSARLAEWVERYRPWLDEKGIDIALDIVPDAELLADTTLVERIVGNLLDNAIRYTPAGGHIRVTLQRQSGTAVIRICDTGPGIPAAERERVFDRFTRLDHSRRHDGNGLGLAIVRWATQLHGGTVRIEANRPCGACFIIELPTHATKAADLAAA